MGELLLTAPVPTAEAGVKECPSQPESQSFFRDSVLCISKMTSLEGPPRPSAGGREVGVLSGQASLLLGLVLYHLGGC